VDRQQSFDGLELHDESPSYEHIDSVPAVDGKALVYDSDGALSFEVDSAQAQLVAEARLVSRFE
jgi:hypothetical protein